MPKTLLFAIWMICRTPPSSATTGDEYCAPSVTPVERQSGLPVFLSSAAIVPFFPPGVTINASPSTSGDSL